MFGVYPKLSKIFLYRSFAEILYNRCRRKLRFKDGATRVYVTTQLIDACALRPGDVIHVHSARQLYSWALVCDVITSQQQQQVYKVAMADGRVVL